ncbi:MAG: hypothetical protein WBV36_01385 [Terriglobales bacterium]
MMKNRRSSFVVGRWSPVVREFEKQFTTVATRCNIPGENAVSLALDC